MRLAVVMAMLLGAGLPADAAAPREATVQHYGAPMLDGRPLPFSEAVRVGDTLYLSGQIGRGADGKLPAGIAAQTRQALANIGATLKSANAGFGDVFHCTAYLADMKDWPAFNAVYVGYFTPGRMPARSALGANGLALGAAVELECQAYVGRK